MRNPRHPHVSLHGPRRRIGPIDQRPHPAHLEMTPRRFGVEPPARLHRRPEVEVAPRHRINTPLDERSLQILLRPIKVRKGLRRQARREELRKISRRIEQKDHAEQASDNYPVTLIDQRNKKLLQSKRTRHRTSKEPDLPKTPRRPDVTIHRQLLQQDKPRHEKVDQDEDCGPEPAARTRRQKGIDEKERDESHQPH